MGLGATCYQRCWHRAQGGGLDEDVVIGREGPEESQPLGRGPSGTAFLSNPSPPTQDRPAAQQPLPFPASPPTPAPSILLCLDLICSLSKPLEVPMGAGPFSQHVPTQAHQNSDTPVRA